MHGYCFRERSNAPLVRHKARGGACALTLHQHGLLQRPFHGTEMAAADGSFIYTPAAGFYETDSFTYEAIDGQATSGLQLEPSRSLRTSEPSPSC